MKRLPSLALTIIVLLAAALPAHAQTYPGSQPPGQPQMPYCNFVGYVIPPPSIGGATDPIITPDDVAVVQASDINPATTAITHEVWRVKSKPDPLQHWEIEYVGLRTTPAAMGICATSGTNAERTTSTDIPDIIIDPEAPAHAGIGAGGIFYRDCMNVIDDLNQRLDDAGLIAGASMATVTCLPFFWATAQATCATLGPAMVELLRERAQMFRRNSPTAWGIIIGSAYERAAHLMQIQLNTFCLARNLI